MSTDQMVTVDVTVRILDVQQTQPGVLTQEIVVTVQEQPDAQSVVIDKELLDNLQDERASHQLRTAAQDLARALRPDLDAILRERQIDATFSKFVVSYQLQLAC